MFQEPIGNVENGNNREEENSAVRLSKMHRKICKTQSFFALKLTSKHLLPIHVVDDIINFNENIHARKIELISCQLQDKFGKNENVEIDKVTENIHLFDNIIGLKTKL